MTRQERLDQLVDLQHSDAEDPLLFLDILACERHQTVTRGVNETYVVFLEYGRVAFHKPFRGISVPNALNYGHEPDEVPINECAAWRLAERLGPPYAEIVPPTVARECGGRPGSLAAQQLGIPHTPEPLARAPDQALAAAFFDALIGQQDRHSGNYRWDANTGRLGLIDHGYAFALPGHRSNASIFVGWRAGSGHGTLTADELHGLDELLHSGDTLSLRRFMLSERCDALEDRARRMLNRGTILGVGEF